ncbi:MAG: hypothetical protein AAGJ28_01640 [Pseudomonadota bacterium]
MPATRLILISAAVATTLSMGACARQISPDVHSGPSVGETLNTYAGTVEAVRIVEIQESDTLEGNKTGQLLGGLAGGAAGARFGDGVGRALAIAAGAIIGSFAGALAEQEVKRQPAQEVIVRTDRGDLLTMVQGIDPRLVPGQRVFVQQGSYGRGRIIPAA